MFGTDLTFLVADVSSVFQTTIAGTSTSIDLDAAYERLTEAYDSFELLVRAVAFLMGIVMIFRGIAMYRAFGQHVNQMTRNGELAGPAVYLVVGTLLLNFPVIIDASLQTTFGTTDLVGLKYTGESDVIKWNNVLQLVTLYARLIGLIAFVRGLYLISKAGDPGVQPGTISKGLVHFVAGVLLVNIGMTFEAVKYTFGLTVS